ncbi:MAG TPA: hypothetical protein VMD05_00320 [Candidatus Nanoarchaeia archaeon]|nr:hypothetical protein [Candidatus Nanoarchaeia archaeon]
MTLVENIPAHESGLTGEPAIAGQWAIQPYTIDFKNFKTMPPSNQTISTGDSLSLVVDYFYSELEPNSQPIENSTPTGTVEQVNLGSFANGYLYNTIFSKEQLSKMDLLNPPYDQTASQPFVFPSPSSTSIISSLFPAIQLEKTYGEGYTASVSNLIQTSDGGYAFLDCGNSYQFTFTPATLYKLDSSGSVQWNKTVNHFAGHSLIQTSDSGYEISGLWSTYGTTYVNTPTVIKTDSEGNAQWYENTSTVYNLVNASSSIQTSDGGYACFDPANVTGFSPTEPPTANLSLPSLVKTDSNNNTLWVENLTYSGPFNYFNGTITFPFEIFSLVETSDGAIAGLGIANPTGFGGYIYLMKTAPFLPLPSQNPLPTPLPSPSSTSTAFASPSTTPQPTIENSPRVNPPAHSTLILVIAVVIIAMVVVSLLAIFRKSRP